MCPNSLTVSFSAADVEEMQAKILAIQGFEAGAYGYFRFPLRRRNGRCFGSGVVAGGDRGWGYARSSSASAEDGFGSFEIAAKQVRVERARQELWSGASENSAVVKMSVLPALIAKTIRSVESAAKGDRVKWKAVFQAGTGIGWLRLDGPARELADVVSRLRAALKSDGGSLVIAHRPQSKEMECD